MLFNSKFMSYFGDITGTQLAELIQLAMRCVSASSTSTQPHSIILQTIYIIDEPWRQMCISTISFGYDGNGYINTINIDKKCNFERWIYFKGEIIAGN